MELTEAINYVILTIGLVLGSIIIASKLIESATTFTYFFAKGNSEAVSNNISELITVASGTPGNVEINYIKPSTKYDYTIFFGKRMVFVDTEVNERSLPLKLKKEDIEDLLKNTASSSAIDFEVPNQIGNLFHIEIKKEFSNQLNVKIDDISPASSGSGKVK